VYEKSLALQSHPFVALRSPSSSFGVKRAHGKKGGKRNKILIYGRNENGNEFRNKKLIYRMLPALPFLLTRPRPVAFIYLHMIFRQMEFE
jgi:hypothetical protein